MEEAVFMVSQQWETLQVHLRSLLISTQQFALTSSSQAHTHAAYYYNQPWTEQLKYNICIVIDRIASFCTPLVQCVRSGWGYVSPSVHELSVKLKELVHNVLHRGPALQIRSYVRNAGEQMLRNRVTWQVCSGCIGVGVLFGYLFGRRACHVVSTVKVRGVGVNRYTGIESVHTADEVPMPLISNPHHVLIQVRAASVDSVDLRIASGYGRALRRHLNKYNKGFGEFPVVLGRDCSGVVMDVGSDVKCYEIGDRVWLSTPYWSQGLMSEYICVSESHVAKMPSQLMYEGGASIPYSAMVLWNALVVQAEFTPETAPGQRVLIHVGDSGVGVLAIQVVKAWGGHVTTTVGRAGASIAAMLSADDVIIHTEGNFTKELLLREKFDVILNTVGSAVHSSCLAHIKEGGVVVSAVASVLPSDSHGILFACLYSLWIQLRMIFSKDLWWAASWESVEFRVEILEEMRRLVEAGKLRPVVDRTFEARDADLAFQHLANGGTVGKPVIRFRPRHSTGRRDHL